MEFCIFCHGPPGHTTGFCCQCGQAAHANQGDQQLLLSFDQASPLSQCPRCGEATIVVDQRFCSPCGLALTSILPLPDHQLVAQFAGAKGRAAVAQPDRPLALQMASGPARIWGESPTVPEVSTSSYATPRLDLVSAASGSRSCCAWLPGSVAWVPIWSSTPRCRRLRNASLELARPMPARPTPSPPATPLLSAPVGTGYWHSDGTERVDAANQPGRSVGSNWFGFESSPFEKCCRRIVAPIIQQ
jgi:hypothetical protein